jgi:hypothetical protein
MIIKKLTKRAPPPPSSSPPPPYPTNRHFDELKAFREMLDTLEPTDPLLARPPVLQFDRIQNVLSQLMENNTTRPHWTRKHVTRRRDSRTISPDAAGSTTVAQTNWGRWKTTACARRRRSVSGHGDGRVIPAASASASASSSSFSVGALPVVMVGCCGCDGDDDCDEIPAVVRLELET